MDSVTTGFSQMVSLYFKGITTRLKNSGRAVATIARHKNEKKMILKIIIIFHQEFDLG